MGFLDKLKGMFSKGHAAATDIGAKAQDVAQDHAGTINNAINTVTDKIPGTVDDNIAAKAQDALGITPAPAAPAAAPTTPPTPAVAAAPANPVPTTPVAPAPAPAAESMPPATPPTPPAAPPAA